MAEWVRSGGGNGGLLDEYELHEAEEWGRSDAGELGFSQGALDLLETSRIAIGMQKESHSEAQTIDPGNSICHRLTYGSC